jgi:hypothetical protein
MLLETLSDLIITYEVLYNHEISFLLTRVLFARVTEALISCLILSFIEAKLNSLISNFNARQDNIYTLISSFSLFMFSGY